MIKEIFKISLLSVLLTAFQVIAFSEPGQAPPPAGGNVSAPLNVGNNFQNKAGVDAQLWIDSAFGVGPDQNNPAFIVGGISQFVGIGTGVPAHPLEINGKASPHVLQITNDGGPSGNGSETIIEFKQNAATPYWEIGMGQDGDFNIHSGTSGLPSDLMHIKYSNGYFGINNNDPQTRLDVGGEIHATGQITSDTGIGPPYVSYSNESHSSIRKFAKDVPKIDSVMQFWNGEKHRMEVYVIAEDKFYTIDGTLVED